MSIFFFGVKTRENAAVLDFLAVDNFDFTRKIVKKMGEKLVKTLGFCQNWIFGQKFDFSNSVHWCIFTQLSTYQWSIFGLMFNQKSRFSKM